VTRIKRFFKWLGLAAVALAIGGGVLYLFGLRVVLSGGGIPRLAFVKSAETIAREVEEHRAAQRAATESGLKSANPEIPKSPSPEGSKSPNPEVPTSRLPVSPLAWTDFRGPARDGIYREMSVITAWPAAGLKPIWKQPVGGGYASFTVAHGRAFTIEQRGPEEVVAAYDVRSGRELWTTKWRADFRELMGGDGPRATPVWSQGFVYALGAEGELRSLDETTGQPVWRTNILEDSGADNVQWGMAASPLIVDDMVIVMPGGSNGRSIAAYDRRTGKRLWSAQDDKTAYVSPMAVTLADTRQLLVVTGARMMGLSLDRGTLLWEYPWRTMNDINAAQPLVVSENRVFISSGYGMGAAVIEIVRGAARAEGRDRARVESRDEFTVREIWRNTRMKNRFASSVLHEGHIYGLDESILACIDASTGELKWKEGRYGYGQLVLADGHLIVLTEDGDLALVRAAPAAYQEVVRFSALSGKTWNVPAIADGILLVRNLQEMAAYDLRK
jgi:outer membrane protein assembly factor BamB